MNITFHNNGLLALKDSSIVIGANKHWYSTENIISYGKYEKYIMSQTIFVNNYNNIKLKIRFINHIITLIYLQPSKSILNYYKSHIKKENPHLAIHLRIGDVDNLPFHKYLYKSEVNDCLNYLKSINNHTKYISVVSDSIEIKHLFKNTLENIIIFNKIPCHSRNRNCIFQAVIDILILKYSNNLILTRGSTFSLFGMYQNKNCLNNNSINFIGHDYEHNIYYD